MSNINDAISGMKQMDDLAALPSPVHSLHPLAKLLTTVAYILTVVSFHKYDLTRLFVMILYPAVMFALSGIRIRTFLRRAVFVMPLIAGVGLFNPFFDRVPYMKLGPVVISAGVVSMVTLLFKGLFTLAASFLLAATTPPDSLCASLRKLHVPGMIVTLFLLTWRYAFVCMEEAAAMNDACRLRAPGQKGIPFSAWGSFLGQLLLRSMDRAQELYNSMLLRGFDGEFRYAPSGRMGGKDLLFVSLWIILFILARKYRVAVMLGGLL